MGTIIYVKTGRFYRPQLSEDSKMTYGKYGQMRLEYLKSKRQDLLLTYQMKGVLNQHLLEVDIQVKEMMRDLVVKLKKTHPMPETSNNLLIVSHLNNLAQMAEELLLTELIYK